MSKSTIEDLPKEIMEAIPEWETIPPVKLIVEEALAGEYHDFKNVKYVCGKVAVLHLMTSCHDRRLQPMIDGIMNGDYDESPDENDKANMKKEWLDSGGTIEGFKKMFGDE